MKKEVDPSLLFGREYALSYLVCILGRLTRQQVVALAETLYQDIKVGVQRSLREACEEAGIMARGNRRFGSDRFLNHVTPVYEKDEMERELQLTLPKGEYWSDAHIRAGNGPARILLLELYSLDSLGLLTIERPQDTNYDHEYFVPTDLGVKFQFNYMNHVYGTTPLPQGLVVLKRDSSSFYYSKERLYLQRAA